MADSVGMGMIGADDGAAFLDDGKGRKANGESCSVMMLNDPKKVEETGGKVRRNRPDRKGLERGGGSQ